MKIPNLKPYLLLEVAAALTLLGYGLLSNGETTSQATLPSKISQDGFVPIFDGKSLESWEFDPVYWSVKEGAIVGEITAATLLKNNTFIIWKGGELGDFELKVDFRQWKLWSTIPQRSIHRVALCPSRLPGRYRWSKSLHGPKLRGT
jgi:hypothetical protein